jgi:hypothetical protein
MRTNSGSNAIVTDKKVTVVLVDILQVAATQPLGFTKFDWEESQG